MAVRLYVVPSEHYDPGTGSVYFGPKYFAWSIPGGIPEGSGVGEGTLQALGRRDYGFIDAYMVCADLLTLDHNNLIANADVYCYPEELDQSIIPAEIDDLRNIFEGFHIPTDWLTPANTYRELIHQVYGIIKFAGRFAYWAGEMGNPQGTFLFSIVTLDTQYSDFDLTTQQVFNQTLVDFGYTGSILPNMTMRQMLKAASDEIQEPMPLGGYIF